MPIQLTRPLVFFALETTGVDAKTARIIEVSVAKHLPDGAVESKTRRFNPGMPIPAEAGVVEWTSILQEEWPLDGLVHPVAQHGLQ